MAQFMMIFDRYSPFVGRVFIASLFIYAGVGKVMGFAQTAGFLASIGLPVPTLLLAASILVEIGGGVMLLIGYKTKWAAYTLTAFVLLTIILFHRNFADQNQIINALKNLAIMAGLMMYSVHGSGALGLDTRQSPSSPQQV